MDDGTLGAPTQDGHLERGHNQLRVEGVRHRPTGNIIVVRCIGYALALALGTWERERARLLVVMLAFIGVGINFQGLTISLRQRSALDPSH